MTASFWGESRPPTPCHHVVTSFIGMSCGQHKSLRHTGEKPLARSGGKPPVHADCCALLQPPHFVLVILGENSKQKLLGFSLGDLVLSGLFLVSNTRQYSAGVGFSFLLQLQPVKEIIPIVLKKGKDMYFAWFYDGYFRMVLLQGRDVTTFFFTGKHTKSKMRQK